MHAAYARSFSAAAIHHESKFQLAPEAALRESDTAERLRELGLPKTLLYPRITPRNMRMDIPAFIKKYGVLEISKSPSHSDEVVLQGILYNSHGLF